jgi:hypothetical protein
MNMVDDATSATQARLGKEETIWAAVGVLRAWIGKYGVPRVLYTDWKNVYTYTNGKRKGRNRCGAKFRLRSLDACARSWAFGSSPPVRPRPMPWEKPGSTRQRSLSSVRKRVQFITAVRTTGILRGVTTFLRTLNCAKVGKAPGQTLLI